MGQPANSEGYAALLMQAIHNLRLYLPHDPFQLLLNDNRDILWIRAGTAKGAMGGSFPMNARKPLGLRMPRTVWPAWSKTNHSAAYPYRADPSRSITGRGSTRDSNSALDTLSGHAAIKNPSHLSTNSKYFRLTFLLQTHIACA